MVLVSRPEEGSLARLQEEVELRLACTSCCRKKYVVTYTLAPCPHPCGAQLLLARSRGARAREEWYEVRRLPVFPLPARYEVCWHYRPRSGCTRHQQNCTFSWNEEEKLVWSFERKHKLERSQLRALLQPTQPSGPCAPSSWQGILNEYGGQFQEVCEQCFYQSPPMVTLTSLCQSHPRPVPLLMHILIDESKKQCHPIHPMPGCPHICLCSQASRGLMCGAVGRQCPKAHSEVELAVWRAEQDAGLTRGQLVGQGAINMGFYCRLCRVSAPSQESFEMHCASLEHGRMMASDSLTVWNYRAPPLGKVSFTLCNSPQDCMFGDGCQGAHSPEELQEWMVRVRVGRWNMQVLQQEGLQSYQERLLQEYQLSGCDCSVLSEEVEGVNVSYDSPRSAHGQQKPTKKQWQLTLRTKMVLIHVALLKHDPGATFSLTAPGLPDPCSYARGGSFQGRGPQQYKVGVTVEASVYGVFEQWVVLDFGIRPVLLQKLRLQVGGEAEIRQEGPSGQEREVLPSCERWHPGRQLVIPCKERTQEEKHLLLLYQQPVLSPTHKPPGAPRPTVTAKNYREQMHGAIGREEAAREQVIGRLNLKVLVTLSKMALSPQGMKVAPQGELLAEVPLPSGTTPDSEEGYLLHRSVSHALIAPVPPPANKVYEVSVDAHAGLENSVLLQVPERCCQDLGLEAGSSTELEVQFQLDRLQNCMYHEAVDRLLEEKLVLPELSKCRLPNTQGTPPWGNPKQQLAASYICGSAPGAELVPPLLIYGPFGTGKTFTMAKAALEVIKQPGTRVLICTHNNSAADLYVREHFHQYVSSGHPEATPLRVKYRLSPLNRTDPVTLQYCPLTQDGASFLVPPRELLERHRITVTTAVTSRDLDVPRGFFSHILLDESAQMPEPEALIPLALADHCTRVVIAGDHMQESPRLFYRGGKEGREEHTLLTRLFSHYQGGKSSVAKGARIVFHQNYRSAPAIISFVSRCFYVGRGDGIEACAGENVAPPPGQHALGLCHARGHCTREGNSWLNHSEVLQIIEVIGDVLNQWPKHWGPIRNRSICVISQGSQVRLIRQELRKVKLSDVTVTDYQNIIGGEFRVIILSTVQTVDSLPSLSSCPRSFGLDFFCDPRILNTILTRARSQVVVVGDMVALCSFGECSRIWRRYLGECVEGGSAKPPGLTVEEIKQVVRELQAWREAPPEEEEDGDPWVSEMDMSCEDSILEELLECKTEACVTLSEEGMLEVRSEPPPQGRRDPYTAFPEPQLAQYLLMQPNVYKRCLLHKDHFDRGYALTLTDCPPGRIHINGRVNCGLAFSGDQVVVQILPDTDPKAGKVVGVLKASEEERRFLCFMDPHDCSIMIPVERSITKIFCPVLKGNPVRVPIRQYRDRQMRTLKCEPLTPGMRRSQLFVVQVIAWRKGFYYPLGIVTRILRPIQRLDDGLEVLDLEFGVTGTGQYPLGASEEASRLCREAQVEVGRRDCRNILTFTVDPRDAKDLDDAISVQERDGHYEIGVHITDLASVIPPGGDLDREAMRRGVTFYSPKREAAHMLPVPMCTARCSLKPLCERRALSLFVLVEKETDWMVSGHLCQSVISSDRQLSYEEANAILADQGSHSAFGSVEGCLAACWHFSQVHRAHRLQEAATYKQPDEKCPPGARKAQMMIEEMMILYNSWVADFLTGKDSAMDLVPVRCQAPPTLRKIQELRDKFSHLLPLSSYLSHHLLEAPESPGPAPESPGLAPEQRITVFTPVWQQIEECAARGDYDGARDLLLTDDLHPELCHAVREFRRNLGRASTIRSGTADATGHYSLQLWAYTWASSPLRRYLDIVVQRLLQGILVGLVPPVAPKDMDFLCHHFERKVHQAASYERKGLAMELALALRGRGQQKLAVVVSVDAAGSSFQLVFPMNGDSLAAPMKVEYRYLQLAQQPEGIPGGVRLSWRRRVYCYHTYREKPLGHKRRSDITTFSARAWYDALYALSLSDPGQALCTLHKGVEVAEDGAEVQQSSCGHHTNLTLELKPGDTLPVQLCSAQERGIPMPRPQLFSPTPGIHICLEHSESPVDCFSGLAHRAPLRCYGNAQEYQAVWGPLCAMEAAMSAVGEGNAVVLRNVPIRWHNKDTGGGPARKGSFKLTPPLIADCELDMDFQNCYLCLRMEGLQGAQAESPLDSHLYTWVAHCLTDPSNHVTEEHGGAVTFHLHQRPNQEIPEAVLHSDNSFTVELIPKLLPDIRKEAALDQMKEASELAKNIVLGKRVTETGTGKTVVGVHIIYWFHQMNQGAVPPCAQEGEGPDRKLLMYCGPSNKSVDVLAEMLLPLRTRLRPLRVYSEQIELDEFPYPGSGLRMSGYLREGKPNPELRSITLHHLIRQPTNQYANRILLMDRRIQNGDRITPEEVAEYKKLLYDARSVELARHDIILCTCITSSGASLTRLPVSQLVIDESAMCTEPETLVPLVSHKRVQSVVLLGDHRQLRPVVLNDLGRTLRMDRSLFERYQERALLLDTQYRMHSDICEFPSEQFYDGRLHTYEQLRLQPSLFCHPRKTCCPIIFGEVDGEEQSLQVTSEEGYFNSKANLQEAEQAVRLVKLLVGASVTQSDIAVLTPYNAQASEVKKRLQSARLGNVTACTVMKSQGSEWRYVIFSTVRSAHIRDIDTHPTFSWQRRHLGFLTDPNQVNVGLTRAKEGLCVLGKSWAWGGNWGDTCPCGWG
uniref:Helicase with zinc finger 2, transcriptional coactivator n=1 Tax=Xenopus tropicalis TaxID=8364 RepID=A0A803K534_XENTR